jgi:predicted ATPase
MLTRLRVRNLKAWKDSGDVRLAPLTVLFGANSAGKTSIPQLLLLLKQTAEAADRHRALQFGDSRSLVDLGAYDEAVHAHDVTQPIDVELRWMLEAPLRVADPLSQTRYAGNALAFQVSIEADKRHQPIVRAFEYRLDADGATSLDVGMRRRDDGKGFELHSRRYRPVRRPGRVRPLPPPMRFYGFPDEAMAQYQNTAFMAVLVRELERLLRSIFYVGPLREYPGRLHRRSGEAPDHVGVRGDRAVEALLASGARAFSWKPGQKAKPLAELAADRLRSMGLIRDFEVKALGPRRQEVEVLVRTGTRTPAVKLTDVGFGVSQVLLVIVECFYVPRRSIVIFEQPEIHLHPRVQADLADLFVDAIHAREGGVPRDCQFIIESHSEHFLRRLQRRIAEEALAPAEAALYFVHTGVDGARLEELKVDTFGNILNWPEGFFGDEMEDLVARTEAQARRTGDTPRP